MKFAILGARHLMCAVVLMAFLSPVLADEFSVTSGLTAHWYSPDRSGEGLVLEILDEDNALVYWFTYDEDGNQRWLFDVGTISDNEIVFPELTVSRGGKFGPDFDPDEVEFEVAGEAVLSFSSCNDAEFSYSAFGQAQTIPMTRLSQTMAAGCQPINGVPGQPVREYAGQSGSWYDPSHAGEGYTLHWLSHDQALLMWFSYDPDGNQYWMIGMGDYEDGRIEFPELFATHGARFGEAFESDDVEFDEWGSLSLEIECLDGTAQYDSEVSGFGSGGFELNRLTQVARPSCPYQAPSLTDLFEVEYAEIPLVIPPDDPNELVRDGNIVLTDIALDGTVVGFRRVSGGEAEVLKWSLGDQQPEFKPDSVSRTDVFISPDSSNVFATLRKASPDAATNSLFIPAVWTEVDSQWLPLIDEDSLPRVTIRGISQDGSRIVGRGLDTDDGSNTLTAWSYSEEIGELFLPLGENINTATGYAVSNDGKVVVGHQLSTASGSREEYATRWVAGGEPEILQDNDGNSLGWSFTCNHDCSVIAGSHHGGIVDYSHPQAREAWVWTSGGDVTYLGGLSDAVVNSHIPPYLTFDVTNDGSLFVGRYLGVDDQDIIYSKGLIWTQATGLVSVTALLDELGYYDDNWEEMSAVAVSPDGRYVLLGGAYDDPPHPTLGRYSRGAILTLTARHE